MQKKMFPLLFIIIIFISHTQSFYIQFQQKPVCIIIPVQPGKQVKFFYQIAGKDKNTLQQVNFIPENKNQNKYTMNSPKNQTTFSQTIQMKVCFVSLQKKPLSAIIEYFSHDSVHLQILKIKSQFFELHQKLYHIGEDVQKIISFSTRQLIRQDVGDKYIDRNQDKIQMFAIVKILAIIIILCTQFFLLRKIISGQAQGYKPV